MNNIIKLRSDDTDKIILLKIIILIFIHKRLLTKNILDVS